MIIIATNCMHFSCLIYNKACFKNDISALIPSHPTLLHATKLPCQLSLLAGYKICPGTYLVTNLFHN